MQRGGVAFLVEGSARRGVTGPNGSSSGPWQARTTKLKKRPLLLKVRKADCEAFDEPLAAHRVHAHRVHARYRLRASRPLLPPVLDAGIRLGLPNRDASGLQSRRHPAEP